MKKWGLILASLISGIVSVGSVMAFDFGGFGGYGGYGSSGGFQELLSLLLNDQWIQFLLLFMVFFGVIFYATKRAFRGDTKVAMGVSFAVSLIIVLALAQKGYLYNYLGGNIGQIAIFFAILLCLGLVIRLAYVNLGKWTTGVLMVILYFAVIFVDLSNWLPYGAVLRFMEVIQTFFRSLIGIIIYLILLVITLAQSSPFEKTVGKFFRRNG